ncbi:hypothetical protein XENOCAPTIV_004171 [Xenoophorus captivus]|uniref:Uncharacterized protein n=1 Tax=Xenoophorus captivus TaxID=1517983 RepID=A0ABV0QYE9_9TELE
MLPPVPRDSRKNVSLYQKVEKPFRTRSSQSVMELPNAMDTLEREADLLESMLPSCHDVQRQITTRFIRLRLRIAAKHFFNERKKILANAGHLGSKSQAKNMKKKQCQTSS